MTCFVLIRHGETDHTGSLLSGRLPGVLLNKRGLAQAAALPDRLRGLTPDMVCTSPLERCRLTAEPLARAHGLQPRTMTHLLELDYGRWQGKRPQELEAESYWQHYNRLRSVSRIPGGEMLVEAQLRMLHALETLQQEAPDATVVLVSHSDPIKAILGYLLGLPLEFINRLTVAPASVSVTTMGDDEPHVHCINSTGAVDEVIH